MKPMKPDDTDLIQQAWEREDPSLPTQSIGIFTRIWHIQKIFSDDRRRTMKGLQMEPALRDLLANLRRAGHPYCLRVGELANLCRVSKGAITQRVLRAELSGLVRKLSSKEMAEKGLASTSDEKGGDGRAAWVILTPKGQKKLEASVETILFREQSLLEGLTDEEIASLSDLLRKLLYSLENNSSLKC
nr:MarR family transcriptional regulator [uncultured Cohaesibacter sp.]